MHQTKKNWKIFLAEVLILAGICGVLGIWISRKEGYHMDEMLSYEMADAEFNPWIVPTQPEGRFAKFVREELSAESFGENWNSLTGIFRDFMQNRGNSFIATYKADVYEQPVWISAARFRAYVTTDAEDAFNYLSVYFNVRDDTHPPLYYMLLHTVSSVFKDRLAPWMGGALNILFLLGCCALMIQLGQELTGNRMYGWLAAILYGCSCGAIATVLLTRMYGMMTFFCLWELYLHIRKRKTGEWERRNKGLILLTTAGFLTQYFFVLYMIGLALVTVSVLCREKSLRALFVYLRSMVIAAILGVCLFPFCLSHILTGERGADALGSLLQGFGGYGQRIAAFGSILVSAFPGKAAGVTLCLVLLAVLFLLRGKRERYAGPVEILMLVLPTVLYFLLAAKLAPFLVDRYVMPLFPLTVLIMVWAFSRVRIPAWAWAGAALALAVMSSAVYDGEYLYRGYGQQLAVAEAYSDLPCVCVYTGYGYYENLPEFTEYERTLLVTPQELAERSEDAVLEESGQLVILIKSGVDQVQLEQLLAEKYSLEKKDVLLEAGAAHGDSIWLCGTFSADH